MLREIALESLDDRERQYAAEQDALVAGKARDASNILADVIGTALAKEAALKSISPTSYLVEFLVEDQYRFAVDLYIGDVRMWDPTRRHWRGVLDLADVGVVIKDIERNDFQRAA